MSNAVTIDEIRELAERCEIREQRQRGRDRVDARRSLASKIGVLPGTLETLARKRLKRLDDRLRDRLTTFAIGELRREITRLQHELEMACRMGDRPDSASVGEIETHLAAARRLISEAGWK